MRNENDKKLKQIKMKKNENEKRKNWVQNSYVQIYSKTQKNWFNGKIKNVTNDDEGEWLEVEYSVNNNKDSVQTQVQRGSEFIKPLKDKKSDENAFEIQKINENVEKKENYNEEDLQVQCRSLTKAAMIKINVTDSMSKEFFESPLTLRGLTLAIGVEQCCGRIINSQGQIRQSVFLAAEILKFKPANMKTETKVLWDTVDDGVTQIFCSALEMAKVSSKYFGFFLRFQSSFQFFVSCYQQNQNVKLFTSL
eukprot:398474_1